MTVILGEAWIEIRAKTDQFEGDLESGAQPGFVKLGEDAEVAGQDAGGMLGQGMKDGTKDLQGDMEDIGSAAGAGLSTGVKDGAKDLSSDLESVGSDAGSALSTGVKNGSKDIESDLGDTGLAGGTALRKGVSDGSEGIEDDLGAVGSLGGVKLREGVEDGAKDVETDLETTGEEGGGKFKQALSDAVSGIAGAFSSTRSAVQGVAGDIGEYASQAGSASDSTSKFSGILNTVGKAAFLGVAGAAVVGGAAAIKMATDFQQSQTLLVTGAGESKSALAGVTAGILQMASAVGQTPLELSKGMFLIESAGYHGAAGLTVLKSAAEGASVGGAQMTTVADALTTAMHDYNIPTAQANSVTSALIETVASGKTNLEALGGSLGKVMPQAAALGISFQQVTGAMATMTDAGLSARLASMHLSNTLLAMSAPSTSASAAMASVGLTSQQVKDTLDGPGGLGAAITLITDAVGSKFPAGSVAGVNAFKAIMGGATGYSTALMLGGKNTQMFATNVQNIGHVLDGSSKSVQGFSSTQKDLAFQMAQAKAGGEALLVTIGDKLIPIIEKAGIDVEKMAAFLLHHKDICIALAAVIGGVLVFAFLSWAASMAAGAIAAAAAIAPATALGAAMGETALAIDAATAPIAAIIIGLVLLGVAIYELVTHWSTVWGEIKAIAEDAWKFLTHTWDEIYDDVKRIWDSVVNFLHSTWSTISNDIHAAWNDVLDFFKKWWPLVLIIMTGGVALLPVLLLKYWRQILSDVETAWGAIVSFFTGLPTKILNALSSLGSLLLGWITKAWSAVVSFITTAFSNNVTFWGGLISRIINAVSGFASQILNWITTAWNAVVSWLSGMFTSWVTDWANLVTNVIAAVSGFAGNILQWIEWAWNSMVGWVSGAWNSWVSWWEGLPGAIISALSAAAGDLETWGGSIIESAFKGITSAWSIVTGWFGGIWNTIWTNLGSLWTDLENFGKSIVTTIINGIKSVGGQIGSTIVGFAESAGKTALYDAEPWHWAEGGFIDSPKFGLVGEAGPEVILPLKNPSRMAAIMAGVPQGLLGNFMTALGGGGSFGGSVQSASATSMSSGSVVQVVLQPGAVQITGLDPTSSTAASAAVTVGMQQLATKLRAGTAPTRQGAR
jgi:TP901 family phage tail tape measure protein